MAEYEESNNNQFVLPEVVFEILKRLPVKSLCRFKCVSILWHAIISDRGFASSHRLHRRSSPKLLVTLLDRGNFATQDPKSKDLWLHLHSHHGHGSDLERAPARFQVHAEPYGGYGMPLHVSQSVGGLVCLERGDHIKICNPSTGQDVSIRAAVQNSRDYNIRWTSLCFDPVTNQHKVLQSIANIRLRVLEHHVMTFSAAGLGDRSWRRIREVPLYSARCIDRDEVCLNGVLYYRVRLFVGGRRQRFLMLFHVHEERFQLGSGNLDTPGIVPHYYQQKLVEYSDGRVAIVDCPHGLRYSGRGGSSCIKLRVLDRSGATCHMQSIALPPEGMLPRDSRLSVLGSIHAGKVLVFMLTVGSYSSCLFYDAKIDSFTKRIHIHMPQISGGYPLGWPIFRRLSVSDHEENIMAL